VKVTNVVLARTGVSGDTTLNNVYLFNGAVRLTDSATVSNTKITFNDASGIVTIPAKSSVVVAVKSDILTGTSGQTVGVMVDSVSTDASSVSGLPVSGNHHTIATASLAGVNFNASTLPSTAGIDPQDDYVMWQNTVSVTTRDVKLHSLRFRQLGSVENADLGNFRLLIDGVQVGDAVASIDSNRYVTFDLSASPATLKTGNRVIKLMGDVVGGSSQTFQFQVRQAADVEAVDTQYGAAVLAQANSTTFSARTTGTITVNSGTLTVTKTTDSPAGNVTLDGSGVTLAKFELKAAGEDVKVESLGVSFNSNDGTFGQLRNGALFADGVQVGSTADITNSGTTTFNLGSSLTVMPGTPVMLEVRADINDNDGTNNATANDTITIVIDAGSSNAELRTSLSYINAPGSDVSGNSVTVASGSMTLAKYSAYANQTVVVPATAKKIGEFRLTTGTTEAVNLNTITVAISGSSTVATDLNDLYVVYGANTTNTKSTVAATQAWSVNQQVAKNTTVNVEVYANMNSSTSNGDTVITTVTFAGTAADSGQAVTSAAVVGQTMTAGTGSISSALDASTPGSALVVADSMPKVASFKFTATNNSYTIKTLAAKVPGGANAAAAIENVVWKVGGNTVATQPLNGTYATSSGLSIAVPANESVVVDAYVDLAAVGTGYASTTQNVGLTLDAFKHANSNGVEATDQTDRAGNATYVTKTVPTISNVALPSTVLANGTQTVGKFKVDADSAGAVAWKKVTFNVTINDADAGGEIATSSWAIYEDGNGTAIASTVTQTANTVSFVLTNEKQVSGSKTYVVKTTVSGSETDDSIGLSIASPSSAAAANTYAVVAATSASFVWSDMSLVGHDATTADWLNDYKVKNLPTDTQTVSR
jgi:hypothetical protein